MSTRDHVVVCRTMREFAARDGQFVRVEGTYHALAVHQHPKKKDITADHAAVWLADGTEILLEPNWSAKARRSESERQQFEGLEVLTEGVARVRSPEPADDIAYVTGPCLSPVLWVRARDEEESE